MNLEVARRLLNRCFQNCFHNLCFKEYFNFCLPRALEESTILAVVNGRIPWQVVSQSVPSRNRFLYPPLLLTVRPSESQLGPQDYERQGPVGKCIECMAA